MPINRLIKAGLIVTVSLVLGSCGGGAGNTDTPSPTAINATVSALDPIVKLAKVVTVDFTGQTALIGQPVSIAQVVDPSLNTLATNRQTDLDVDLSDPNTIQITTPVSPTGNVTVTVNAASAITNAIVNQAVTVYAYTFVGDSGDGEDTVAPLPATVDTTANTITVSVPWQYFQATAAGTYVANLKIGVATASSSPAPATAHAVHRIALGPTKIEKATTTPGLSIPCPLGPSTPCVETSRYNPNRVLNGNARFHYGVDFKAQSPLPIIVPAGGVISPLIESPDQYVKDVAAIVTKLGLPPNTPCPDGTNANLVAAAAGTWLAAFTAACAAINGSGGITLQIDYTTYKIKLLHLSSLDPSIYSNGKLTGATTSGGTVAQTGQTGAAEILGPHLHYEVYEKNTPVCGKVTSNCAYVSNTTDPFPFIATQLSLTEGTQENLLKAGAAYNFVFSATDSNGINISSNVGNPQENGGVPPLTSQSGVNYDPTRKICLSQSNAFNTIQFIPAPDNSTIFSGLTISPSTSPSYCAPWSTVVTADGLAYSPTTTITANYSADATKPVSQDPLSTSSAAWILSANALVVAPQNPSIAVGANVQLSLTDTNGNPVTPNPAWTWSSNNAAATVDPVSGLVTGVSGGTATITATDPNSSANSASTTATVVTVGQLAVINPYPSVTTVTTTNSTCAYVIANGGNSTSSSTSSSPYTVYPPMGTGSGLPLAVVNGVWQAGSVNWTAQPMFYSGGTVASTPLAQYSTTLSSAGLLSTTMNWSSDVTNVSGYISGSATETLDLTTGAWQQNSTWTSLSIAGCPIVTTNPITVTGYTDSTQTNTYSVTATYVITLSP